jgi:Fe-S cluster assembly protein SufD
VTQAYLQEFGARTGTATADGPEWLGALRRSAMDRFALTGFPTSRDEEWRFTPIAPIAKAAWRHSTGSAHDVTRQDLAPFIFGHPEWTTLVFVDGAYSEPLSATTALAQGVRVGSLSEALKSDSRLLERHLARHAPIEGSPFTHSAPRF